MRRTVRLIVLAFVSMLLVLIAACSDPAYTGNGAWQSQLNNPEPQVGPQPQSPGSGAPPSSASPSSGSPANGSDDPNVMATNLNQPWGIAPLPDGTVLVGERTTGKVFKVFSDHVTPKQLLLTIPGLDASGDGGLLGLATSPTFAEDGLIFAYITTPTDNRVVSFTLNGTVVPVLTGIPKGATHNGGALVAGPDGNLYVGTGDTGDPSLASDDSSLAGKVLRIDDFGDPVSGNEHGPIFARGLHDATGICLASTGGYVVDAGTGTVGSPFGDALYSLAPGADFGTQSPVVDYSSAKTGAAGCSDSSSTAIVTTLDAKALFTTVVDKSGKADGTPQQSLSGKYGRLRGIAADSTGNKLWIATSNTDAAGTPGPLDDRVILVPSPGGGGGGIT